MTTDATDKKKRVSNACDECKRRKVRCDSYSITDGPCSSCLALNIECTRRTEKQKRGPKPGMSRTVLSQSCRDSIIDILKGTPSESLISGFLHIDTSLMSMALKLAERIKDLERDNAFFRQKVESNRDSDTHVLPAVADTLTNHPDPTREADARDVEKLAKDLAEFTLSYSPQERQPHFGESSNMMLVLTAVGHRKQVDSAMPELKLLLQALKRPQFWNVPSWIPVPKPEVLRYNFPNPDDLRKFVDAYFNGHNLYSPLLHRPSFESCLSDKLHLRDEGFGALVLGVCAIGCRYLFPQSIDTDNMNVMLERSGLKWFQQLPIRQFAFGQDISLHHLQMYCLALVFLQNVAMGPDVGWTMTGIAIRLAQEKGAHRRFILDGKSIKERELWKRVFWILIFFDVKLSMAFGRPRVISMQDFDIGLPVECDDEYWDNPDHPFVQPPEKPSKISFWNHFMRLAEITSFATQSLYSVRKTSEIESRMGASSPDWLQKTVLQTDSALNEWVDAVPSHLRWDVSHQNKLFFQQSAVLYATYYHTQIQVHRRFIPRPGQDSRLSFPSLTICTNAARTCVHIVETCLKQTRDSGMVQIGHFILPLFASAMVLAVNLWRGKHVNSSNFNPRHDITDIYKCIDLLRTYESRHILAGRLVDIINTVMSATQCMLGNPTENLVIEAAAVSHSSTQSQSTSPSDSPESQGSSIGHPDFNVPLYTSELGQAQFETSFFSQNATMPAVPYAAQNWGYNHSITTEELAIFDDHRNIGNDSQVHDIPVWGTNDLSGPGSSTFSTQENFSQSQLASGWPSDLSQPQDWDMFMANMDQLLESSH